MIEGKREREGDGGKVVEDRKARENEEMEKEEKSKGGMTME